MLIVLFCPALSSPYRLPVCRKNGLQALSTCTYVFLVLLKSELQLKLGRGLSTKHILVLTTTLQQFPLDDFSVFWTVTFILTISGETTVTMHIVLLAAD